MRLTLSIVMLALPASIHAQQGEPATPVRDATLHTGPGGAIVARLRHGAALEVLARDRGWVRVRTEGWVRASEIGPADSAVTQLRSSADLRADPIGSRGKLVRWNVELISLQNADPLRRDLAEDEPYILARGPGSENALLYIAVPGYLLPTVRALPPLSRLTVVARVRTGRSEPVGIPVLDLESVTRRP